MGQASLDDDDLFGEATGELREDVESSLAAAAAALPPAESLWNTEAENVLGVLNGLQTSLDTGEASEHLRDARKWFTVGVRAEAFDSDGELAIEIQELESTIEAIESVESHVTAITSSLPELRDQLDQSNETDEAKAPTLEPQTDS